MTADGVYVVFHTVSGATTTRANSPLSTPGADALTAAKVFPNGTWLSATVSVPPSVMGAGTPSETLSPTPPLGVFDTMVCDVDCCAKPPAPPQTTRNCATPWLEPDAPDGHN